MRKKGITVLFLSFLCALSFFGCSPEQTALTKKDGIWAVYERECRKCHKINGKGSIVGRFIHKMPDFTNTKWQDNVSDSRLIISVANGKGKMPGYKGKMKDEEIVDLVKVCVRSFYPPEAQ